VLGIRFSIHKLKVIKIEYDIAFFSESLFTLDLFCNHARILFAFAGIPVNISAFIFQFRKDSQSGPKLQATVFAFKESNLFAFFVPSNNIYFFILMPPAAYFCECKRQSITV